MLFSEFRDGNVPADYDLLRPFKQALELVPAGVDKVYLRSDTAGYQVDLLKYCAEAKSKRFGVIEFAVGADVTEAFKKAVREVAEAALASSSVVDGRSADTGQEYAEVCFVPNWVGHKKHGPAYRYLAIREPLEQPTLPGMDEQLSSAFPDHGLGNGEIQGDGNRDEPGHPGR